MNLRFFRALRTRCFKKGGIYGTGERLSRPEKQSSKEYHGWNSVVLLFCTAYILADLDPVDRIVTPRR